MNCFDVFSFFSNSVIVPPAQSTGIQVTTISNKLLSTLNTTKLEKSWNIFTRNTLFWNLFLRTLRLNVSIQLRKLNKKGFFSFQLSHVEVAGIPFWARLFFACTAACRIFPLSSDCAQSQEGVGWFAGLACAPPGLGKNWKRPTR